MARSVKLPDPVVEQAEQVADERDMSLKEAVRYMIQEGGYNV